MPACFHAIPIPIHWIKKQEHVIPLQQSRTETPGTATQSSATLANMLDPTLDLIGLRHLTGIMVTLFNVRKTKAPRLNFALLLPTLSQAGMRTLETAADGSVSVHKAAKHQCKLLGNLDA